MTLLLDTHIYLWYLADSPRITQEISAQISEADLVLVSAASVWEAAIKIGLGKLDAKISDLVKGIEASGFSELPVSAEEASMVASLPPLHNDPFDRLLVAQALAGPFRLLTADPTVARYSDVVQLVT
ncbi:MAG: type II toxin-antitoxin system VapC family toxin [Firmicutes bacterium]|nr:type II toxin-antitoxin system VapC family toxin [Bacillota bacterium]MCL5064945.1 type II toxin-antitoxin system VapC family toxin [Bacillota bacterium]